MQIVMKETEWSYNPFFTLEEFVDENVYVLCDIYNQENKGKNIYNQDFDTIYEMEDKILKIMVDLYEMWLWDNK